MSKRVLVTGASGFIGRNCLAPLAARGFEIHAVSSRPQASGDDEVVWHQADLLDRATIEPLVAAVRPTHLLHLAWIVAVGQSYTSPDNLRWVQSSLDLASAFAAQGGKRMVVSGSCYEYDLSYGVCHEARTPRAPGTTYGVTKNALQELLAAWAPAQDVSLAWPRLFFLYGPHEGPRRLVSSVVRALLNDEQAACSHGRQLRDYLYAGDAAEALAALLDCDASGAINIGTGMPVSLRHIVERIAEQIGRPDLLRLGALPARPDEPPLIVADIGRQAALLDWRPTTSLDVGLERSIAWWQSELALH
jgi:nucleoside-diphosphate-sugar epimerase